MATLKNILVDIDTCAAHHPALDQALSLATRCGARVKIVDVVPLVPRGVGHFVTPERERDLVEHRRERLSAIAGGLPGVGATADIHRGRPGTALIEEVLRSQHDLLVRSHGRDDSAGAREFGAIDMELLRQCPCPVWLVAHQPPHRPWRILAAIRAGAEEEVEQALNSTILEWALMLYGLGDAQPTIFQAWSVYGASVLKSHIRTRSLRNWWRTRARADIIVMGWRGHGPVRRLLAGSMSRGVVRGAPCAVLVVRRPIRELRHVVVGGSENAERAVKFLGGREPLHGARATVFNAVDIMHGSAQGLAPATTRATVAAEVKGTNESRRAAARKDLSQAAKTLSSAGSKVDQVITNRAPLRDLLATVSNVGADLLVVGARGVTGLRHLLLGSVAEGALNRSPVPVLVVR